MIATKIAEMTATTTMNTIATSILIFTATLNAKTSRHASMRVLPRNYILTQGGGCGKSGQRNRPSAGSGMVGVSL
jgi:hypothetical protein